MNNIYSSLSDIEMYNTSTSINNLFYFLFHFCNSFSWRKDIYCYYPKHSRIVSTWLIFIDSNILARWEVEHDQLLCILRMCLNKAPYYKRFTRTSIFFVYNFRNLFSRRFPLRFLTDNSSLETDKCMTNSKNYYTQTSVFRKYQLNTLVIAYLQVFILLESPPCDECGSFIQDCSKHLKYGYIFGLIYNCVAYDQ